MVADMLKGQAEAMAEIMKQQSIGRAPGSKVTAAPPTRAGAGAAKSGSMRTVPVNQSTGPLPDAFDPARVISIVVLPSVCGEWQSDADHEARGRAA
jgi:hypothetical protein